MKIAIVTKFPAKPTDPCGGVEAVSVKLVGALAGLPGLELHVVTTDLEVQQVTCGQWNGVTIHRLPQPKQSLLSFAAGHGRREMCEFLASLNPQLVHAHDVYGLMVKGLALPRVFTVHGFIHEDTLVSGTRWARLRWWLWRRAETAAWADQPYIISISPYVREYVRHFSPASIYDIDNPVGAEFFAIPRCEEGNRIFCAPGSICPRKNVFGLVRAFARLKALGIKASLRISGGAHGAYYEEILGFIREHGLQADIAFLGRLSHDQICGELAAASAFALVSLEENSPVSIEEAMAAGVPVVTSNRCGMPYLVRDGESGRLVDPQNPADIASALAELFRDTGLRRAMGLRAKEVARDRFHPDKVAARTRDLYFRILQRHRGGESQVSRVGINLGGATSVNQQFNLFL